MSAAKLAKEKYNKSYSQAVDSLDNLERALAWLEERPDAEDRWGRLDAVAKRFETSFVYIWRALRGALMINGIEVYGPKDAISRAGTQDWIDNLDQWEHYMYSRNAGVHDYFGLSSEEYAKIARSFLKSAKVVLRNLPHPGKIGDE